MYKVIMIDAGVRREIPSFDPEHDNAPQNMGISVPSRIAGASDSRDKAKQPIEDSVP